MLILLKIWMHKLLECLEILHIGPLIYITYWSYNTPLFGIKTPFFLLCHTCSEKNLSNSMLVSKIKSCVKSIHVILPLLLSGYLKAKMHNCADSFHDIILSSAAGQSQIEHAKTLCSTHWRHEKIQVYTTLKGFLIIISCFT